MAVFDGVSKDYRLLPGRQVPALRDLSLTVQRGEVMGVAGPNGSESARPLQFIGPLLPPFHYGLGCLAAGLVVLCHRPLST